MLRCHCIVVVCGDGGGVVCADDVEIVVFFVFIPCVSPPQKRIMHAISPTMHNYALQYSFLKTKLIFFGVTSAIKDYPNEYYP